ncbi:MAG: hypothetical protein J5764_04375 [Bacteroidales bacterium]|nr:hypothetical protein [Bacteroidales bacterium]
MTDLKFILRFLLLIVLQIIVLATFNFSQYVVLFFIPAAIICIPVRHGSIYALVLAFIAGMLVDFFSDGMLGLVTCALLPVAFTRDFLLKLIFGSDFFTHGEDLSIRRSGFGHVLFAVFLSTTLFITVYVIADGAGTRPLWFNLARIAASSAASTLLSIFTVNVLASDR